MSTQSPLRISLEPEQPSAVIRYDPEPRRDWVRAFISVALVVALLGVIAYALYSTSANDTVYTRTRDLLDRILTPLIGLIGTALGFYFGRSRH